MDDLKQASVSVPEMTQQLVSISCEMEHHLIYSYPRDTVQSLDYRSAMPELPGELEIPKAVLMDTEVERARKLIAESLTGYKIVNVDAQEDQIVYTGGTNHKDFVRDYPAYSDV